MNKCEILDCTLRDGGYINQWIFGESNIAAILKALIDSRVDYIECGYISSHVGRNSESTLFSSLEDLELLLQNKFTNINNSSFVAMINIDDFDDTDLPNYVEGKSFVNGIRLAFRKDQLHSAIKAAGKISGKGYNLYVQPMVIQSYTDEDILHLINAFKYINTYAVYIVDSFGSLFPEEFRRCFNLFDQNLEQSILLGYHAHNNLQLAYSNAIDIIKNIDRNIIIDASIFGMGRGAGNLNSELIADYLNRFYNASYKITPMLEVIDNYLEAIKKENNWGFSVAHFLSAVEYCHPSYASHYTNKKNLTVSSIRKILNKIDPSYRNHFSEKYAEQLYFDYKSNIDFKENIPAELFNNSDILLIASGSSVNDYKNDIDNIITERKFIKIAVNHIPVYYEVDYYFFSNQKRYIEFASKLDSIKIIATSDIDMFVRHESCYLVGFDRLLKKCSNNCDNAAILLLNLLVEQSCNSVSLIGLDGYNLNSVQNYSYPEYGRPFDLKQMETQNKQVSIALCEISNSVRLEFITPSIFEGSQKIKILGVIPARYSSTRFPGKPLVSIAGIPMLLRTYLQANKCTLLDELVVATDDKRIQNFCKNNNIPSIMTSKNCLTGTDRISEVSKKIDADLYVNIQGDEPVMDSALIDEVVEQFHKYGKKYIAYNLYKLVDKLEDPLSDSLIKVIVNEEDELMYMSRLPVPFEKNKAAVCFKKQVCVYGFTKKALTIFSSRDKTLNEKYEDIEILRFLDMGYRVKMSEVNLSSIAVDIPEDIEKVENYLRLKESN